MKFIADLHIHSHYSIATSKKLIPEYLDYWARIKGIDVIGTGDCIHPGWLNELQDKLEEAGNGFYRLKEEYRINDPLVAKRPCIPKDVYFMLKQKLILLLLRPSLIIANRALPGRGSGMLKYRIHPLRTSQSSPSGNLSLFSSQFSVLSSQLSVLWARVIVRLPGGPSNDST